MTASKIGRRVEFQTMAGLAYLRVPGWGLQVELRCALLEFREWSAGWEVWHGAYPSRNLFLGPLHFCLERHR